MKNQEDEELHRIRAYMLFLSDQVQSLKDAIDEIRRHQAARGYKTRTAKQQPKIWSAGQ